MTRISAEAYQALREALAVIFWNKRPFETYLRTFLREEPKLLASLAFTEPKRVVADTLVDRLIEDERSQKETSISLMLEIAGMEDFPNIDAIKDPQDRTARLQVARRAVQHLRRVADQYRGTLQDQERVAQERQAWILKARDHQSFSRELGKIRSRFLSLQMEPDHQLRGKSLESLLTDLFVLFDMEPRFSYNLALEQIDGSLSFDTDDYIVEARWRALPADRGDADIFAAKVRRKGKNALGLFVSVSGFTSHALEQYRESTPFITMNGEDVYLVLDQRVRLDELIRHKKRHANETGACFLPASLVGGF